MTKRLMVAAALIPVIFFTSGCGSQSKEKTQQSQSNQEKVDGSKDYDPQTIRSMMLKVTKEKLPVSIDSTTVMSDASTDGDTFIYKYEVKGISDETLKNDAWRKPLEQNLIKSYCSDDSNMKKFREVFSGGNIYNYYSGDKLFYTYKALPSACH